MKNSNRNLKRKNRVIFVITTLSLWLVSNTAIAQNSWIGGTPGSETEWSNPKNWSENRVPDWSDESVIIADIRTQSGFFPTISKEVNEIGHLRLEGGAILTIGVNGKLIINGSDTYNFGILNIGSIINYGFVSIKNTGLTPLENIDKNIENKGAFAFIDNNYYNLQLALNKNTKIKGY